MAWWVKIDSRLHRHPKIRAAGRDARDLFTYLLMLNENEDFDGHIPATYLGERYLADELQCGPRTVAAAIAACKRERLLAVDDPAYNVGMVIVGWSEEWKPKANTGRERTRDWRRNKAAQDRALRDGSSPDVTRGDGVTLTRPDQTRPDQTVGVTTDLTIQGELPLVPPPMAETSPLPPGTGGPESPTEKARRPIKPSPEYAQLALEIAGYLAEAIRSHNPDAVVPEDLRGWSHDVDLALRCDFWTADQIRAVIDYAHRGPRSFWRPNILSGTKLRKHMTRITTEIKTRGWRAPGIGHAAPAAPSEFQDGPRDMRSAK